MATIVSHDENLNNTWDKVLRGLEQVYRNQEEMSPYTYLEIYG